MLEEPVVEQAAVKSTPVQRSHVLSRPIIWRLGMGSVGFLPSFFVYGLAESAANLCFLLQKKPRESVKKNLSKVFPRYADKKLTSLARRTFKNYSRYLVDYGRFSTLDRASMFKVLNRIDGKENLRQAMGKGKGIILITAHLGNWELGGIFFGRQNIKINVLTHKDAVDQVDEIKTRYRALHNINTIVVGDTPFSAIEIMNALHQNEVVAMLVDRYGREGGIEVDFLGKKAYFPEGPVLLGKMSGAPILPAFVVRDDEGSYSALIDKPIEVSPDRGKETLHYVQEIAKVFEIYIRRYPDQWYNFVAI